MRISVVGISQKLDDWLLISAYRLDHRLTSVAQIWCAKTSEKHAYIHCTVPRSQSKFLPENYSSASEALSSTNHLCACSAVFFNFGHVSETGTMPLLQCNHRTRDRQALIPCHVFPPSWLPGSIINSTCLHCFFSDFVASALLQLFDCSSTEYFISPEPLTRLHWIAPQSMTSRSS